jgi:kynureninase
MTTRDDCLARDAADPLAPLRAHFAMAGADQQGVIYLDGNSLGALPAATAARVAAVVQDEWGVGLIRSWNTAGWIDLGRRIGDKLGTLIGAAPGEVTVADSTSINLYKVLSAAIAVSVSQTRSPSSGRFRIVSERSNFPTDLYIAETLAQLRGFELVLADADDIPALLDHRVAVLMLTHVNYRTGRMHHMADVTSAAHRNGAVVLWDLAHSAGAVPVDLTGADADFAVGCGYKYLNGGPGAPAFAWAHPRHVAWMDRENWRQPLSGWLGHAAPFEFTPDYRPGQGMSRFICGTPPMLSLAALECGVDTVLAADPYGGMAAIRDKSIALTDLFIALVESRCAGHGLTLVTPRDASNRGSQASFAHATGGYPIMQALIARGVIGDFRAPDILRFGFTPLYSRFVDVWDAVSHLEQVMTTGKWREPRFNVRAAVT